MANNKLVLIIGYVWPEPNSSAAGQRMVSLIQWLSKDHRVVFASAAEKSLHRFDISLYGATEEEIKLNCSSFDKRVEELQPEIVIYDRFMMEEQFGWRVSQAVPSAMTILDMEDIHSLRDVRNQQVKISDEWIPDKELPTAEWATDLFLREIAAIYRCDLTLVTSDYEYHWLLERGIPEVLLHYCPLVVSSAIPKKIPSFEEKSGFMHIGNFRHQPNWDAVLQLKQHIWPKIRQSLPKACLSIYGAYPPKKATQLHNPGHGFYVHGWCDDAQYTIAQHRVMLSPLRFGAGLKGKIISSAQLNTAVISTSIGFEGIMNSGYDSVQEFSDKAIEIYTNKALWEHQTQVLKQHIRDKFDANHVEQKFINRINELKEILKQHRQHNFIGRLLVQQERRSTQYFSQWIELKNKLKN